MKGQALYSWQIPPNLNWVKWDGKESKSPVPLGKEHYVKARLADTLKGPAELTFPIPLYFHVDSELDDPEGDMDWKHHDEHDEALRDGDVVAYAIVE
jgi:hypothetical protein